MAIKITNATASKDRRRGARGRAVRGGLAAASVALVAVVAATSSTSAIAADVDCPTASEQGQKLRDQGKILRAREMFLICARATCPSVVRKDCAKWLPEVEESMPTVVFAAEDGRGADVATVTVSVDDAQVSGLLDGKPVSLDPGQHVIKAVATGAAATSGASGATSVTQNIIVRAGEKNRLVKIAFPPPAGDAKTPDRTPDKSTPAAQKGGIPVATYVLGGVGVLALGSFAFFGITGKNDLSNLKSSTCAPYCAGSDLDSVKTKLIVADVSVAVGILAIGGATVFYFTSQPSKEKNAAAKDGARRGVPVSAHLDVTPIAGGAAAVLRGQF